MGGCTNHAHGVSRLLVYYVGGTIPALQSNVREGAEEDMAIDITRARTFVEQHGAPLDRARLAALLDGVLPSSVPEPIQTLQNPDGGFPVGLVAGRPSALSPTALALT